MINTLADARRYIEENGLKHVQIIGDFYHMNIEEDSLTEALHQNRDLLGHVHIADNHRYQPGSGSLDFAALFNQLRADCYQGYVVYECRVRADDPARPIRILSLICVNAKDDQRDECFNTFASACRHYWCRAGRGQSACLVLLHAQ